MKLTLRKAGRHHAPKTGMYAHVGALRYVGYFSMMLLVGAVVGSAYFIYRNVYVTIDRFEGVDLVERGYGIEVIDFRKFDLVVKSWEAKRDLPLPPTLRNPFDPTAPAIFSDNPLVPLIGATSSTISNGGTVTSSAESSPPVEQPKTEILPPEVGRESF